MKGVRSWVCRGALGVPVFSPIFSRLAAGLPTFFADERNELARDVGRDIAGRFLAEEVGRRAIYFEKGMWAGDQRQRGLHLRNRAKWVARAVNKKCGRHELREMLCTQPRRFFRRMQRIRQEQ